VKKEYLEDDLFGLNMLIQLASGTPIEITGTGNSFDAGMGPKDDES